MPATWTSSKCKWLPWALPELPTYPTISPASTSRLSPSRSSPRTRPLGADLDGDPGFKQARSPVAPSLRRVAQVGTSCPAASSADADSAQMSGKSCADSWQTLGPTFDAGFERRWLRPPSAGRPACVGPGRRRLNAPSAWTDMLPSRGAERKAHVEIPHEAAFDHPPSSGRNPSAARPPPAKVPIAATFSSGRGPPGRRPDREAWPSSATQELQRCVDRTASIPPSDVISWRRRHRERER